MQSFIDAGGPLSPSSFFSFDGPMDGGNGASDDGVDLFKYYMDLQAFQGKDQQPDAMNACSNSNSDLLSPYNAFFKPSAYSASPAIAPSSLQPTSSQQRSIDAISQQSLDPSSNNAATSGQSLFPFAEASSSAAMDASYGSVNPSSILSFDHLAGSENPQPIDPHLLMSGPSSMPASTADVSTSLPQVKEEDVESASAFPLSNLGFPLSLPTAATATIPSTHAQPQSPEQDVSRSSFSGTRRSASAMHDDSMNGIDGLSDDQSDSEGDHDEEEEDPVQVHRKRSSITSAKKRTSAATKATSTSRRAAAAQSKKELSVGHHSQTHPHALVPVPEWEDKLSKAEYDKLSSKEKRQMRNKISARNFRHRRKAHIDTLEALVADKEQVISVLSEEVSTLRSENQGLRADIELLKKNWESIAAKIGASVGSASSTSAAQPATVHSLTPDEDDLYGAPGSLPALSPAASSSAESTNGDHLSELSFEHASGLASSHAQAQASEARPSTSSASSTATTSNRKRVTRSSIQRPNLRKDLGPSGASFSAFGMGHRSMNVHTTLIPELNFNFPVPPPSVFSNITPPTSTPTLPPVADTASASSERASPTVPPCNPLLNGNNTCIADMLAGKRERDANANARLNMNPALNGLTQEQINNLREQFFNANSGLASSSPPHPPSSEDIAANVSGKISRNGSSLDPLQNSFFDTNPFISLRQDSLQDYRAQLYAKLANNVAGIHQAQHQQSHTSSNNQQQQGGIHGLRPAFFAHQPVSSTDGTEDINKGTNNAAEVAKIASIAQKTLFDKLSTAFWDAFAGNNTPATTRTLVPADSSSARKAQQQQHQKKQTSSVDCEQGQQVADLLAGRSRLQIVKNEDATKEENKDAKMDLLAKQVAQMGFEK